jgi:hypothetical protein
MRKRRSPRLFVIQAASGAGKSSFLKAGLWPRLKRDPDFAPLCILRPAQGILTGPDGIGHRIPPWLERQRRMKVPGDIEASLTHPDPAAAVLGLAGLLAEATALATTARRAGVVDARPPAPLLAIDQGERCATSNARASSRSRRHLPYRVSRSRSINGMPAPPAAGVRSTPGRAIRPWDAARGR